MAAFIVVLGAVIVGLSFVASDHKYKKETRRFSYSIGGEKIYEPREVRKPSWLLLSLILFWTLSFVFGIEYH